MPSGIRKVVPTMAGGAPSPAPAKPVAPVNPLIAAAQATAQKLAEQVRVTPPRIACRGIAPKQLEPWVSHNGRRSQSGWHPQAGMSFAAPGAPQPGVGSGSSQDAMASAQQRAAALAANPAAAGVFDPSLPHFETELEINDFPQRARWKVRVGVLVGGRALRRGSWGSDTRGGDG